jgi:hypothetical protein
MVWRGFGVGRVEKQHRDRNQSQVGPDLSCSSIHLRNPVGLGFVGLCWRRRGFGEGLETQRSGADELQRVLGWRWIWTKKGQRGGRTGTGRTEGGTREGEGVERFWIEVVVGYERWPEIVECV